MEDCRARGVSCHNALMDRVGWPAIPYDGQLLVSHQDALLMGGKVQAPPGYADHVRFIYPDFCERCVSKMCIEMCSGQAITRGRRRRPAIRSRKVRPLRRVHLELRRAAGRGPGAQQISFQRRRRRTALHGELVHRGLLPIRTATAFLGGLRRQAPDWQHCLLPNVTGTSTFTVLGGRQSLLLQD